MFTFLNQWSCLLLLAASHVAAEEYELGRKYVRILMSSMLTTFPARHYRRQPKHKHIDVFQNFSTITTTSSQFSLFGNMSSSTTPMTNSASTTPPPSLPNNFTAISLSTLTDLPPNTLDPFTISVGCNGTATYTGSVPPTVYLTITEGYDVTLTAANASVTVPPLLITPASACFNSIIQQTFATLSSTGDCYKDCPEDQTLSFPQPTATPEASYTSTVYVTKKTPVPVIQQSSTPPPDFHVSSTTRAQKATTSSPGPKSNGKGGGGATVDAVPVNTKLTTTGPAARPGSNVQATGSVPGPSTTIPRPTIENQHITTPAPGLTPETVAGVTFSVGPTQAVISGTTYSIGPGAKPTTITIDGKAISIGQNGVGFASTTVAPVSAAGTNAGTFSVVTADGLTISVDNTEAIISGTTYQIASGAPTRTIVINGHTISIGPGGLGLGTTTVSPVVEITGLPTFTGSASTTTLSGKNHLLLILGAFLVMLCCFTC
jgi:hypothetical protein